MDTTHNNKQNNSRQNKTTQINSPDNDYKYSQIRKYLLYCYEQNKKPLNRKSISKNRAKIQFLSTNPISVSSQHTRSPHALKHQLHIIKQYGIAIQSIVNKTLKQRLNIIHAHIQIVHYKSIIEMSACIVTTLNFYQLFLFCDVLIR